MELLIIAAIVLALLALDFAALRFGAESRPGFNELNITEAQSYGLSN